MIGKLPWKIAKSGLRATAWADSSLDDTLMSTFRAVETIGPEVGIEVNISKYLVDKDRFRVAGHALLSDVKVATQGSLIFADATLLATAEPQKCGDFENGPDGESAKFLIGCSVTLATCLIPSTYNYDTLTNARPAFFLKIGSSQILENLHN